MPATTSIFAAEGITFCHFDCNLIININVSILFPEFSTCSSLPMGRLGRIAIGIASIETLIGASSRDQPPLNL